MSMKSIPGSAPRFVVFTVCVDEQTAASVMDGCAYTPDTEFSGEFHDYLGRGKRPQFSQRVKDAAACIAIVDFDRDPDQAAQTAETLHQMFPGRMGIVAVSTHNHPDLLLQTMRAGCNEFLSLPFDLVQYTEAVTRLESRFAANSPDTPKNAGSIVAFFGAKGGVGTTTLAVYLSTFLVRQHKKKVLLVDHHHQLGHVCLYLGLRENPYHFDELLRNVDRLDTDLLAGFLTHHPCGLDLLPSPDTCAAHYAGNPHDMQAVLGFLRTQYDYVVLDSSLEYQDVNQATVDSSDEVYLVSTPDVAALRDLSRHVENFGLHEGVTGKLRIAVNRSSSNDAVSAEQVESAVRFPVSVTIPNNYAELVRAINAGEPISPQRRSEFTAQIGKWAKRIAQTHAMPDAAPKTNRFAFWR